MSISFLDYFEKFFWCLWVDYVYTAFLWYMHITCFCDIQDTFYATIRGSQWGDCYIDRKVLIFFKNGQLFYKIFKSYLSLLKSPEFMTLGVSKHANSTPALLPPSSWLPSHTLHSFIKTTSSDQVLILRPTPLPNFLALALHCSRLKSSVYTYCNFFHIYQSYDKGVASVSYSNYDIVLSY